MHVPMQATGKVITQATNVFDDFNDIQGETSVKPDGSPQDAPSPEEHQNMVSNLAEAIEEKRRVQAKIDSMDHQHAEHANSLGTPSV